MLIISELHTIDKLFNEYFSNFTFYVPEVTKIKNDVELLKKK
jgi:hypothetical protein